MIPKVTPNTVYTYLLCIALINQFFVLYSKRRKYSANDLWLYSGFFFGEWKLYYAMIGQVENYEELILFHTVFKKKN